jgi:integrase
MAIGTITKRAVDTAPVGFLWDDRLKGFGLKATPTGRVYIVQYRPGGRGTPTKRITLGRHGELTPDQARRRARQILGDVAAGRDPAAERRAEKDRAQAAPANTVQSVVELWLARDQAENRTIDEVRRIMAREVLPAWGDRAIESIRKGDVIELVEEIADRAPIQANRVLAYVRRFFNWSAGRDLIEANPAQYVAKPGRERVRDRVLADDELLAVWQACEAWGHPFARGVQLLFTSGARRSEIFEATWDEVDLEGDHPAIHLPASRSKVDQVRAIPLNAMAVSILQGLPRFGGGEFVISMAGTHPLGSAGKLKVELDQRSGVIGWRLHDVRRVVATGMQRLGVRLEAIEATLGHVSGSRAGIVGTYQRHRFETEARIALDAWGRHIEGLITGEPAVVVKLRRRR